MTMFSIETNADDVAARLKAFSTTSSIVRWIDAASPTIIEALKVEAPYGPDRAGQPHLRDRIFSERHSSIGSVQAVFDTDRSPLATWILGGTKPHDIPNAFGWGPTFGIGGRFEGKFHPGTKPNDFNVRAWLGVESIVMDELIEEIGGALGV
jgi:hypothetical protein